MTTYRAVMLTKKGGPEVLETVELPLREPEPGRTAPPNMAIGARRDGREAHSFSAASA